MEWIILLVLLIGFYLNGINNSIITENQKIIADKLEEINNKLKSE